MKKELKLSTIVTALSISAVAIGIGAFAYFSDAKTAEQNVESGTVSIHLVEDDVFTNQPETGVEQDHKTFWGEATGTKKSIARASVFISVEFKNGDNWEVAGDIPSNAVTYTLSKEGWSDIGSDGYYYYQTVLAGVDEDVEDSAKKTTPFKVENIAISDDYAEQLQAYAEAGQDIRINILVDMECCQATNRAYTKSWPGCDVSKLPESVR